jgi:predicted ATP-grasp superfamily ATP-dependent carboligase
MLGASGNLLGPVVAAALTREGAAVCRGHSRSDPPLRSRHHAGYVQHPPLDDGTAFADFILGYARSHGDTVLLPTDDASLIALQPIRDALDRLMPVAAPPPEATATALDKTRTLDVATGLHDSLQAPPTIVPTSADDAVARWPGPWPVIVKPRTGTGSEGIRLARDPQELHATYQLVAADYERPLVQMAVQFDIRRKFHLYYLFDHAGSVRSWYGQRVLAERRSIRVGPSGERIAGGITLLWESLFDQDLLERGRRLMTAIGWRGLGFVEGAYDQRDGKPYLFEINARRDGTQALSLSQGVNLVHDACLVALGRMPPERLRYQEGVRAKRDTFTLLKTGDPTLMLRAFDPRWVSSMPSLSDPRPALDFVWQALERRWNGSGRAADEGRRPATSCWCL